MLHVRIRVRTLMVVAGVAALLIWGTLMGLYFYHYSTRASIYGQWEQQWRSMAQRDRARGSARVAAHRLRPLFL